ncbi:MAG: hypothetical protein JNL39_21900 [Opitutaceae bacterium]|nr:hypothetical protein [Opitutaceae bacterium]
MNLADVSTVVLVIVALQLVFVAWWLAVAGLFPRVVEGCAEVLGSAPIASALLGLACAVPLIVAALAIGKAVPGAAGNLARVAILLATVFVALSGTAGLAWRIGRGLDEAGSSLRRMLRGGVVLALIYLTIVWGPLTLLAGLGAIVRVWFTRRPGAVSQP